ncbi:hypothetical protein, partial [Sphingobium yanoikuyae]|uniref:hypothetical protein n=1 Tax=Sphingobium yanoikuyae TaxID=13690 RepID=UPI001E63971D
RCYCGKYLPSTVVMPPSMPPRNFSGFGHKFESNFDLLRPFIGRFIEPDSSLSFIAFGVDLPR